SAPGSRACPSPCSRPWPPASPPSPPRWAASPRSSPTASTGCSCRRATPTPWAPRSARCCATAPCGPTWAPGPGRGPGTSTSSTPSAGPRRSTAWRWGTGPMAGRAATPPAPAPDAPPALLQVDDDGHDLAEGVLGVGRRGVEPDVQRAAVGGHGDAVGAAERQVEDVAGQRVQLDHDPLLAGGGVDLDERRALLGRVA